MTSDGWPVFDLPADLSVPDAWAQLRALLLHPRVVWNLTRDLGLRHLFRDGWEVATEPNGSETWVLTACAADLPWHKNPEEVDAFIAHILERFGRLTGDDHYQIVVGPGLLQMIMWVKGGASDEQCCA